jgi:hypothetical protein
MASTTYDDGLLQHLDEARCWQLLAEHQVGRIGYVDADGPVIIPLNYRVHDRLLYVRTASHNDLAVHLPGRRAAFEVDDSDARTHTGWSVLVRGPVHHVLHGAMAVSEGWPGSSPWPDGLRTMVFCLTPDRVTGHLLHQHDVSPGAGRGPGTVQRGDVVVGPDHV